MDTRAHAREHARAYAHTRARTQRASLFNFIPKLPQKISAQGARVVAFETEAEWTKFYQLLQANMAKTGKTEISFWLNAGYDQNAQKFRWLTNGKG